jgi:hydroxylamine reductase
MRGGRLMFCNQCEQTALGHGCTDVGMCGKNEDVQSLQENLLYALKGLAAYAWEAREYGATDPEIDAFLAEALYTTGTNVCFDLAHLIALNLKAGEMTIKAMEMLKAAHVANFGEMTPVQVPTGTEAGPAILISGHNLKALYKLLKQTDGKGINVYTHGEMLPAHAYPQLRAFPHLKGNLGGSWCDQETLFAAFPGAVVATTNCVLLPKEAYRERLFTFGPTRVPAVKHVPGYDFTQVLDMALSLPPAKAQPGAPVLTTGFADTNVLPMADKILGAVAAGKIRHFFLVAGCDAPGKDGDYFREFVRQTPPDTVVLTLACGKYRFNDLNLGDIDGIPRLLDLGQCNDAIAAIRIAVALANALSCGVNDLPLTMVLSWMEQKAVAILMGLFSLGIQGIYIGPKPPAWITPNVFKVLQTSFDLRLVSAPERDLQEMMS